MLKRYFLIVFSVSFVLGCTVSENSAKSSDLRKLKQISRTIADQKNLNKQSFVFLEESLVSPVPEVRASAANNLAIMGGKADTAVPSLVKTVTDNNSNVRYSAVNALGLINSNPKLTVPALINALDDQSENVRAQAAISLGLIGKSSDLAIPKLKGILLDASATNRNYAAIALGRIGAKSAEKVLEEVMKEALASKNSKLYQSTETALQRIRHSQN